MHKKEKGSTSIVIGANFGDEGKGLITAYKVLSHPKKGDSIVIRSNGGAQAGHTVHTESFRHVFHHIGSGALHGADTFLSEHFILNPTLFKSEITRLRPALNGAIPTIYAHKDCLVTTPWDMLINQLIEYKRQDMAHGSCGVGINETVTRHFAGYPLTFELCRDESTAHECVRDILTEWMPKRLGQLGLTLKEIPYPFNRILTEEYASTHFLSYINNMNSSIVLEQDHGRINDYGNIVFEGAQGLLLDERHEWFPYVTRSRTGLDNPLAICRQIDIRDMEVIYVTRAYMTRHGAGPFPTEDPAFTNDYRGVCDLTNVPHDFQGSMRFGALDLPLIRNTIKRDFIKGDGLSLTKSLAITCLDHFGETELVSYYEQGASDEYAFTGDIPSLLCDDGMVSGIYESRSPYSERVKSRVL